MSCRSMTFLTGSALGSQQVSWPRTLSCFKALDTKGRSIWGKDSFDRLIGKKRLGSLKFQIKL